MSSASPTSGRAAAGQRRLEQTQRLLEVMARLRDPDHGCPWDLRQDFSTIAPHTIEEAYEVADAIARGDMEDLCDELGDLLLQVAFHARMAEEAALFDFESVARAIADKLVRRHPHVFEGAHFVTDAERAQAWESIKAEERREKAQRGSDADHQVGGAVGGPDSYLAGIARALPALLRAQKLQKGAARAGFDWRSAAPALAKVHEELRELEAEIGSGSARAEQELGDLLFATVNLARHLGVDAEAALRGANDRFEARFRYIEAALRGRGRAPSESSLEEMDALWDEAKASL